MNPQNILDISVPYKSDEDPKIMDGGSHHAKIGTEYSSFMVLGLDGPDNRCMGR
jgi:hypothetical protein